MRKTTQEILNREIAKSYPALSKERYHQYCGAIASVLAEKIAAYEYLLEDFRDNYDCDESAHRYGNLHMCRCCKAEQALNGKDPWGHDD